MVPSGSVIVGSYDFRLVALSVIISVFASYAALDLAARVTSARGRTRALWVTGGATAIRSLLIGRSPRHSPPTVL